jgi:sec-independent protein translocase protein TatC
VDKKPETWDLKLFPLFPLPLPPSMSTIPKKNNPQAEMSFLAHLEALRWHIIRSALAVLVLAVIAFFFADVIFNRIIIAPKTPQFITYQWLCALSHTLGMGEELCITSIDFELINTELSGQFTMHMWTSIVVGIIVAFPYIIWEFYRFIKPALKSKEKKYLNGTVFFTTVLFLTGVVFAYFIIVPLSVQFLGTYQVSQQIKNLVSMDSYISTVTTITLCTGIVFELPIVVYFLSQMGIMSPKFMRTYRKHAIVVILIVAAVITPSPDVTSQMLVALPLYLLYEISIFVSVYVTSRKPVNAR